MSRTPKAPAGERRTEFGRRNTGHTITISRGESSRSFTIQPWIGLLAGIIAVFLGFAYLGATAYLMYRDDIIGGTIARHARLQHAYEDRLASLRAQIDRVNSRQLIDQQALETRVAELIRRQDSLKDHNQRIAQLMDRAAGLGTPAKPAGKAGAIPAATPLGYAPSVPADVTGSVRPKPLEAPPVGGLRPMTRLDAKTAVASVGAVDAELGRIVSEQLVSLDRVVRTAETNLGRFERVATRLGIALPAPKEAAARPLPAATGGPLVPLGSGELAAALTRAEQALVRLDGARSVLKRVPLAVPVPGSPTVTSGFGARRDPFLGIDAMHTGVDYRGDTGDPVLATAAGTVINADREGGYGLMVEIDHGNGITTRYGHLSRIDVEVGDKVELGDTIGGIGSTGRSTGPHLHYETRVRGEAQNPVIYLDAGRQLRELTAN
ncbi:MAG: peptidoglycan DD-metalloendopeptidase family protein [Hyphomicrobiaceae bacterium]|nr:peptidoglycan DD-metalloendopeptidase family protein [Hyphomicrobiaceae bacterium]